MIMEKKNLQEVEWLHNGIESKPFHRYCLEYAMDSNQKGKGAKIEIHQYVPMVIVRSYLYLELGINTYKL